MIETGAWVVDTLGQAPDFRSYHINPPGAGDVVVQVRATGLNFADLLMIEGSYQETPPVPFVPGIEFSGEIDSVGADVSGFGVGDRVMGTVSGGALAERLCVAARNLRRVPDTMDDSVAAGFQIAYGTSHLALTRRARLEAGETVLVLGASGGVGLTAVEIAHKLGARVIAVARGAEKLEVARDAGADVLIDSSEGDLVERFRAAGPIDVVYDAVGGEMGDAALRALGPEGRFLVIGFASGALPVLKPNHLLVKNQTVIGLYWGGYAKFNPDAVTESLQTLAAWHGEGLIRPHISHRLPLSRAMEGLELLKSRQATGKIVITQ